MMEPIVPGATPVPVVVIESSGHTLETWLVISTLALTLVTALTLIVMVHQDHELIKALRVLITALIPKRRNGSTPEGSPTDTGDEITPAAPLAGVDY